MLATGVTDDHLIWMVNQLSGLDIGREKTIHILEAMAVVAKNSGSLDQIGSNQEVKAKIIAAVDAARVMGRNWTEEITSFVNVSKGAFSLKDIYHELHVIEKADKKIVRTTMSRLVLKDKIENIGNRDGIYRKVEDELEKIDYMNAPTDNVDLMLPLGLNKLVNLYPGNIVVIAGEKESGKTAFMLNTVMLNMHNHKINYFSSEMGDTELKIRLQEFYEYHEVPIESWAKNCNFYMRSRNFSNVTKPDQINIFDFMELNSSEEYVSAGQYIRDIWDKLNATGLAIIALQKDKGKDVARGGSPTMEKARLYVSLNHGEAKIIAGKNHAVRGINPRGMTKEYKVVSGCKFISNGDWAK